MSAFFVAIVKIKNQDKFHEYVEKAGKTIEIYDGTSVIKGKAIKTFSQDSLNHDLAVVFKFPNMASLEKWYESDEYQPLIPLREEAIDAVITTYETI